MTSIKIKVRTSLKTAHFVSSFDTPRKARHSGWTVVRISVKTSLFLTIFLYVSPSWAMNKTEQELITALQKNEPKKVELLVQKLKILQEHPPTERTALLTPLLNTEAIFEAAQQQLDKADGKTQTIANWSALKRGGLGLAFVLYGGVKLFFTIWDEKDDKNSRPTSVKEFLNDNSESIAPFAVGFYQLYLAFANKDAQHEKIKAELNNFRVTQLRDKTSTHSVNLDDLENGQ